MNDIEKQTLIQVAKLFLAIRKAHRLTQVEMAAALNTSQPHLSKIEGQSSLPSLIVWTTFCRTFGVRSDALINEKVLDTVLKAASQRVRKRRGLRIVSR